MDLSQSIEAKSDQQNYDDYVTGPKTVTVSEVRKGSAEQPVEIHLVEYPGKPFKPAKTVRRILVAAWGKDSSVYVGRRMTLFGDPSVKWAGQAVGGIRVSHLSDIDKPVTVQLTTTRGKRSPFTVQPLADAAPAPLDVATEIDVDKLRAAWQIADADTKAAIKARVAELSNGGDQ